MHHVRFRDPVGAVRTDEWHGDSVSLGGKRYDLDEVDMLPPCEPSKIAYIGRDCVKHAEGRDEEAPDHPFLFPKPPNAVAGHGDTVTLPTGKEQVEREAELTVVIGEQCRNVVSEDAAEVIAGYTVMNDVPNHDGQDIETNWVRGKAFDGSAPLGPVLADPDHPLDNVSIPLRANGETRQDPSIKHLIFSTPDLVAEVTTYMMLEASDVISTGTPEGVDPLVDGDTVKIEVKGVSILEHRVR